MRYLNRRALLATSGALMLASVAHAQTVWQHMGGAPYASSERDAFSEAKIDFAMTELPVPEALRAGFKADIRANPQGKRGYLDPSDRLVAMMSGPDSKHATAHAMRDVQVGRTVIRRGVVWAAEVRYWDRAHNGKIYRLTLPEVCWNWSLMIIGASQEWCPEIHIPTMPGDRVMFEIAGPRALPASACLAIKHSGQTSWSAIPSECPAQTTEGSSWAGKNCDFTSPRANAMRVIPALQLRRQHGGGFEAQGGVTILRLPRDVLERDVFMVFVCILRGGQQTDSIGVEYHNYLGETPPVAVIYESPEKIPTNLAGHQPRPYDLAIQFGQFGHR